MASAKYHWERDLLRRWYDGINSHPERKNYDLDFEYGDEIDSDVDIGILYGGARSSGKGVHEIRQLIIDRCKTVIINETPLLGRTVSKEHSWHRIGVDGHLYQAGNFNSKNSNNTRIERYKADWKLKFKPWRSDGDYIVLALQLPGDSSLRKQDLAEWAIAAVNELMISTEKDIRIRTHPAFADTDHSQIINLYKYIGKLGSNRIKFSYGDQTPWDEDLKNAYCVVTYSSGLSIDAIDNGIPVITVDQANFAYDISSRYISEINNLKMISDKEKQQWYNDLSFCQWSSDEVLEGMPWSHLLPIVTQNVIARQKKKK